MYYRGWYFINHFDNLDRRLATSQPSDFRSSHYSRLCFDTESLCNNVGWLLRRAFLQKLQENRFRKRCFPCQFRPSCLLLRPRTDCLLEICSWQQGHYRHLHSHRPHWIRRLRLRRRTRRRGKGIAVGDVSVYRGVRDACTGGSRGCHIERIREG